MKNVCVITGGGSGMGLAAAKFMPRDKVIVVSGRTQTKLDKAVQELETLGYEAYACTCDTSNCQQVQHLAAYAASLGSVKNVIHAAGVSPTMADPEQILRINALGTVYVNQEFSRIMGNDSVILDVSSSSAYVLPKFMIREKTYALAESDEQKFLKKLLRISQLPRSAYEKAGLAYAFSKNFVVWYARQCAFTYGSKGIRVLSLSPGLVSTGMGKSEAREGSWMLAYGAEQRMGTPEELGFAIAAAVDERNGYLAGVDILCDGGCTAGKKLKQKLSIS